MTAGIEGNRWSGAGTIENDSITRPGQPRRWHRQRTYAGHLAGPLNWRNGCLSTVPICQRGPVSVRVRDPDCRNQKVLQKLNTALGDVDIATTRAPANGINMG